MRRFAVWSDHGARFAIALQQSEHNRFTPVAVVVRFDPTLGALVHVLNFAADKCCVGFDFTAEFSNESTRIA